MANAQQKSKAGKKQSRFDALYYEKKFRKKGFDLIIGVDEAGRGPLAGPVVAAAVALRTDRFKNRIDDSKKLTPRLREKAFSEIIKKSVFGIGVISEKIIDRTNILAATCVAMEKAVNSVVKKTEETAHKKIHIIVDGNIALDMPFPCQPIVRGDSKSKSIACASILAKVIRDRIMDSYHRLYPQYGFDKHRGYPTREHKALIKRFGPSLIHRSSFNCV